MSPGSASADSSGRLAQRWIEQLLARAPRPARRFGDLEADRLQVIGVDLAHSRMVVFPRDVALYVDLGVAEVEVEGPRRFACATHRGAAKAFFAAEPDGRNTYGEVPSAS